MLDYVERKIGSVQRKRLRQGKTRREVPYHPLSPCSYSMYLFQKYCNCIHRLIRQTGARISIQPLPLKHLHHRQSQSLEALAVKFAPNELADRRQRQACSGNQKRCRTRINRHHLRVRVFLFESIIRTMSFSPISTVWLLSLLLLC